MKHLGPFAFVCCLLIVLGVLFSGFRVLDDDRTPSPNAVVNEGATEHTGEDLLPEAGGDFCTPNPVDAGFAPHLVTCVFFSCIRNDHTGSVNSSGWLMPTRI